MKMLSAKAKISGLTLIEVLAVLAVLFILAAMILPHLAGSQKSPTVYCINNLKQIDLGYMMWASDHNGKFPAHVSVTNGGSMEYVSTGYASLQFRSLSNYLSYPNVFICPFDKSRQIASNIPNLRDENLSYFINADAGTNNPANTILAGDRNLQANGLAVKAGLFELSSNLNMSWTRDLHLRGGVLAFTDGHVQFVKTKDLNSFTRKQPLATSRLCIP